MTLTETETDMTFLQKVILAPPYKHISQQPSLCAPACLSMIFERRGEKIDQLQIAKDLHTKIPTFREEEIPIHLTTVTDPVTAGTDINTFNGEQMHALFDKYGLPLETTIYYIQDIPDLPLFLAKNLQKGNDALVNYRDTLGKEKAGLGHYALVAEVDVSTREIELCDPWQGNQPFYNVPADELAAEIDTIDSQGNRRGIVIFKGIK